MIYCTDIVECTVLQFFYSYSQLYCCYFISLFLSLQYENPIVFCRPLVHKAQPSMKPPTTGVYDFAQIQEACELSWWRIPGLDLGDCQGVQFKEKQNVFFHTSSRSTQMAHLDIFIVHSEVYWPHFPFLWKGSSIVQDMFAGFFDMVIWYSNHWHGLAVGKLVSNDSVKVTKFRSVQTNWIKTNNQESGP